MSSFTGAKGVPVYLGIECGGTHTVALAVDNDATEVQRAEFGPANLPLLDDRQLAGHFKVIAARMPGPTAVAIGMAGARREQDFVRILDAAKKAWPKTRCTATNDLETALLAAPVSATRAARILVLSGTGSCCYGQSEGRSAKVGGWGHILGDKGSGYEIGLRAVKAAVYYYDRDGDWPILGARVLRALMLNEPNDLISWAQSATKTDVAALAIEVFSAAEENDKVANDLLEAAANSLAKDGSACAGRLTKHGSPVQFILAGSVLTKQGRFAARVTKLLRDKWPRAEVCVLGRESVWGAVELARKGEADKVKMEKKKSDRFSFTSVASLKRSPTELRNPRSLRLDKMSVRASIKLMLSEDERIPRALLKEINAIEATVRLVSHALKIGGRLFYAGAGTSGRLGVLDASECPPTFQTPPEMVQGIIAGGQRALWQAVEGAEDDPEAGSRAMQFRRVTGKDVVVGIAASGRTPFVWGALAEAKKRRAGTVLICFNPGLKIPREFRPTVTITPNIGAEILTGSTRLKAGTATKLVLNMLTTLSMVRLGKVLSNLMIDVKASNVKLRDRAARIVAELTGCNYEQALQALQKSGWQIKEACRRLKRRT